LVLQRFHKWIYVFGKRSSERMLMKKLENYAIELEEGFVLRKKKVYLLLRERNAQVDQRTIEERVYQTLKVVSNNTCIFCRKRRMVKRELFRTLSILNE